MAGEASPPRPPSAFARLSLTQEQRSKGAPAKGGGGAPEERKMAASESACWWCPDCQTENQIARWNCRRCSRQPNWKTAQYRNAGA
eukprot:4757377-Alexandrium_andersonii.AAC.1